MATIKFLLQSKKDLAPIYLRLSIDRNNVYKRKTGFHVRQEDWSDKNSMPVNGGNDEEQKKRRNNLKSNLEKLSTKIDDKLNEANKSGIEINGNWLQEQIDIINGKQQKTDVDRLVNYIQVYIDNLPFKEFPNGKRGVSHGTIQKYTTLKHKIEDYQKFKKKTFYVKDVNVKFRNDLLKYFTEVDKLNSNSAGRYIRFLKTVCLDANLNGYEVHPQLKQIKGFTEKASKIYLSFDELEIIEKKTFEREALENARDWLIIGCYIGQRVSDLLTLTKTNIVKRDNLELIELTQVKTGKPVSIPMAWKVREILDKRNGEFPTKLSAQKFNKHIKDLCEIAGINEHTEGAKLDEESGRKLKGVYPKHELVTSHVCRRSFATNFYGEMPTALLISITAHSTEKQFLEYIGKSQNDYATQIAEYFEILKQKLKKEPRMNILREAN